MDVRALLDSLKEKTGIKTDKDLAKELNVQYGTLSKWLARNSLQYEPVILFLLWKRIDLNEIFGSLIHEMNAETQKGNLDPYDVMQAMSHPRSDLENQIDQDANKIANNLKEKYRYIAENGSMSLLKKFEEDLNNVICMYEEKTDKIKELV